MCDRPDGMVVPVGHVKDTGVANTSGYTLNYNEYIVYDARQVKMKYAVQVEFNFDWKWKNLSWPILTLTFQF